MRRLLPALPLALMVATGCAPRAHIAPISMEQLQEFREARLEERLRVHLVVSIADDRVKQWTPEIANDPSHPLHAQLHGNGQRLAKLAGVRLVEHYPIEALGLYVYVFEGASIGAVDIAAGRLAAEPGVKTVQRVNLFRTQSSEPARFRENDEDPLAPLQAIPVTELTRLHALATGRGVRIAIVDTGIDLLHEDLAGAQLTARDLVDNLPQVPAETHATSVTGIMLAQPLNRIGLHGIAPDATVIVLRACWQRGSGAAYCNTFTLAKALAAALEADVDIVNLSLTGPLDPLLVELVEQLQQNNVIVVAAYPDEPDQGPFPARLPGVIAATARPVLADDPGPVYAPGDDVITLLPDNRYGLQDGSSISAAQVSAVACLFRELDPSMTAATLEAVLHGRGVEQEGLAGLLEALQQARN
ncbi:MAG TPA: S8 family serine peptidase [Gammaproteobacteria bacterium]